MKKYIEKENCAEKEHQEEQKKNFWKDNRGVGVIEIVLILVVLVGLVLIFKDQISEIITNAFAAISGDADKIMDWK